jgi:hypothetical protein
MMWVRVVLALIVAAQGLSSFFPLTGYVAYKLGIIHPTSGLPAVMVPLWAATPWWQLVVWAACVVALELAAWRLIRRRPALVIYLPAIFANAGLQWLGERTPAYHRLFSAAAARFDFDRWAVLLLIGALIWWVEQQPVRGGSPPKSAA